MKKIYLYCSIAFILSLSGYAQKQTYNWFYGSGQGITWNRTQTFDAVPIDAPHTTVPLTGIPTRYESQSTHPGMFNLVTDEGCFSLSDEDGNLMFYSSGSTIYNRNHSIVTNGSGLLGNYSSAQSGIIVPFPKKKNKYVVISIGIRNSSLAFGYSVLDSEANNGLGAIELPKNRQFTLPSGSIGRNFVESLAAVKHTNGVDYWIIAIDRARANSKMVAWLLTENGMSTTPVVSYIPNIDMVSNATAYGYLKLSPSGKNFALMMYEAKNILWGEFDTRTGIFSNMKDYKSITNTEIECYGGEFSPNGKYLYVSTGFATNTMAYVFEFQELMRRNTTPIRTYTNIFNTYRAGAIQLGPDYRMYMTMSPPLSTYNTRPPMPSILYVFDKPNDPANTKVYALQDLSPAVLPSRVDAQVGYNGSRLGLPTFSASFFIEIEGSLTQCIGEEAVYTISSNSTKIEVDFDEGDGPVIMDNVTELRHRFKKPGNYMLKLRPLDGRGQPIPEEIKTIYTTVYSCYLPVNHNLINAEY